MKPNILLFSVLFIVAVVVIIFVLKSHKPDEDKNEQQLQMLQHRFDSLAIEINSYKDSLKKYDTAIVSLKLRDSELTGKLEYNKKLQTQLKTEYAKADHFANYNSNDITKYFADSLNN